MEKTKAHEAEDWIFAHTGCASNGGQIEIKMTAEDFAAMIDDICADYQKKRDAEILDSPKLSHLAEYSKMAWRALCDAERMLETICDDESQYEIDELRSHIEIVAQTLFTILRLPQSELQ